MESEMNSKPTIQNEEAEDQNPSSTFPASYDLKFKKKTLYILVAILVACFVYFKCNDTTLKSSGGHAVLTVRFSASPETDVTQIKNTLKIGGMLRCGYDREYTKTIKQIDKKFDDFGAADSNGAYYILPAVLNWISSQGWKFQQKFCVNMNNDNAEYFFVK